MTEIQIFTAVIGWALIHFLWQGTLITGTYWLITRSIDSIHAKYWIGMVLIVLSLCLPILNILNGEPLTAVNSSDQNLIIQNFIPLGTTFIAPQQMGLLELSLYLINASLPFIVICWALTVTFLSIRLVRSWLQLKAIEHQCDPQTTHKLTTYIKITAKKLGINNIPLLKVSKQILVPAAYGLIKPTVLLPLSLLNQLPSDQLEAIIKHELCHLKRNDYVHNIIQLFADIMFFFHPGIRWINNDIRHTREQCCDQMVLSNGTETLTYAKALTNIAAYTQTATQSIRSKQNLQIAANDGMLLNRVKFLLQNKPSQSSLMVVIPIMILIIAVAFLLRSQSPQPTETITTVSATNYQQIDSITSSGTTDSQRRTINNPLFYPKTESLKNSDQTNPSNQSGLPQSVLSQSERSEKPKAVDPSNTTAYPVTTTAISTESKLTSQNENTTPTNMFSAQVQDQTQPESEKISTTKTNDNTDNSAGLIPTQFATQPTTAAYLQSDHPSTDRMLNITSTASITPPEPNNIIQESQAVENANLSFDTTTSIKPSFKRYSAPKYPQQYWLNQIEQEVIATFKIRPNGKVYDIDLNSPQNDFVAFENSVEKAMKNWRFDVSSLNDSAIQRTYQQIFNFKISEQAERNCEVTSTGSRILKSVPCNK